MEKTSIKNTVAPVAGETPPRRSKEEFLQRFRQPGSVSFTEWSDFVAYVRAQQENPGQVIEEKPLDKPSAEFENPVGAG